MVLQEKIVANKYAQAFYHLFLKDLNSQQIESLENIVPALEKSRVILMYIQLGLIDSDEAMAVLKNIFLKENLPQDFEKLLKLLFKDRRILLLPTVLKSIIALYFKDHNIMVTYFESSHALSSSEKREILDFFERQTGRKVRFIEKINKELIAGIKMHSETKLWEYSVQSQLKLLGS